MTIRESVSFVYDGVTSESMGIYSVSLNGGLYEEPFLAERSIDEVEVGRRNKPYFKGVKKSPYTFTLSFYFKDTWDDTKIRNVARWLDQSYYKPLYFVDNPNRIFYCMPVGDISLIHNGLKQGYLNLTMRCDSPYSYTPMFTTPKYTLTYNTNGTSISLNNDGDTDIYPEIWIKKLTGNGDVKIVNMNYGGEDFILTGIIKDETVYIDNENKHIESYTVGVYRYNNFNGNYLKLLRGSNPITVYGDCEIQFRYQTRILQ